MVIRNHDDIYKYPFSRCAIVTLNELLERPEELSLSLSVLPDRKYRFGHIQTYHFKKYECLLEKIPELTEPTLENLFKLVKSVYEALEELHAKGWAHLDVRVDNICWDGSQARLIDLDRATRSEKKNKNTKLWQLLHVFLA